MQRRSERLQNNGYYDMYGQPVISYRETPVRPRRRRTAYFPVNHPSNREMILRVRIHCREDQATQTIDTLIQSCFHTFVFLIFAAFGCIWWNISLHSRPSKLSMTPPEIDMVRVFARKDEGYLSRLQLMETKVDYLLPQVDLWPNFALESQGATILRKTSSDTYHTYKEFELFGVSIKLPAIGPEIVIKGRSHLSPGHCWAFADLPGRLSIALSHKTTVTHVSMSHIPKFVSPTSSVSSAPREFSVYGKENLQDEETHLGTFLYDEDGDQIQTFKLPADKVDTFHYVTLNVNSNWGHPDYTCLYNFRVHGELAK
ncbi:SUN domain-containing protein 2-like [Poeciliopsis prolifica]|uniref:SUN domain-containing protein 2-like n=1 Tax=Poeciliopsis prolifica TaxID=188132 RepID=UPI002413B026|nr:SUN domain-containing protein 2-like [Poeciliopsis prolifica]